MVNTKTESLFILIWAIGTLFVIIGAFGTFRIQHLQRKYRQDEFNKRMDSLYYIINKNEKKLNF